MEFLTLDATVSPLTVSRNLHKCYGRRLLSFYNEIVSSCGGFASPAYHYFYLIFQLSLYLLSLPPLFSRPPLCFPRIDTDPSPSRRGSPSLSLSLCLFLSYSLSLYLSLSLSFTLFFFLSLPFYLSLSVPSHTRPFSPSALRSPLCSNALQHTNLPLRPPPPPPPFRPYTPCVFPRPAQPRAHRPRET